MTDEAQRQLAARMAQLARQVAAPSSLEEVLSGVTQAALDIIPGVDAAGVLLIAKGGRIRNPCRHLGTRTRVRQVAGWFGEGPCGSRG